MATRMKALFLVVALLAFLDGTNATTCSNSDIAITQGPVGRRPNGIPIYGVQITNLCSEKCVVANVHLYCGEFTSANLIDRNTFRRIAYNDCLVNDGGALLAGQTVSFEYTTTFMYPLSVSSSRIRCFRD